MSSRLVRPRGRFDDDCDRRKKKMALAEFDKFAFPITVRHDGHTTWHIKWMNQPIISQQPYQTFRWWAKTSRDVFCFNIYPQQWTQNTISRISFCSLVLLHSSSFLFYACSATNVDSPLRNIIDPRPQLPLQHEASKRSIPWHCLTSDDLQFL